MHDSCIYMTWPHHMCDVWHDPFSCVTWLVYPCDTAHAYIWHDLITWRNHICDVHDMTSSHAWRMTWPILMCDMTFSCVTWLVHRRDTTLAHMHDSCTHMTWPHHLWDISLITFRRLATNYRALLRKMTCKDKASYDSTPLCRSPVRHDLQGGVDS